MSQQIPASFQSKYNNNVELVLQQTKPMLLEGVSVNYDSSAEKIKITDLIGNTLPNEADERHGDTKYVNTPHDGIWLAKQPELYFADLVDNADKLATGIDIEGGYVKAGAATINRAIDRRILEGIYGNVVSGKDGTVVTPFPAAMIVPVTTGGAAGAQRMNTAKLRAANKLLAQNYVDLAEQKYIALTAEQMDDLLSEIPVTSADFQKAYGGVVNDMGWITRLLGWNIVPMELANTMLGSVVASTVDASGYRKNPFWVKSGIVVNFWQRLRTEIDRLPTKLYSTQVFAGTTLGASRTQTGKAGIILNSEA